MTEPPRRATARRTLASAGVAACLWAALALALAGCASVAPVPRTQPTPDAMREQPAAHVVVTVRNPRSTLPVYAASTSRGYAAAGPYRAGAEATEQARRLAERHRLAPVAAWPIEVLGVHCIVYRLAPDADRTHALAALRADPAVESAQPLLDFGLHADGYNDPYAGLQRNLDEMAVAAAQRRSRGDGVRVAVVDTGVDAAHPDFAGRVAVVGDFVGDGRRGDEAHGTAVAGVIGAVPNNGIGIAGIAPGARLLALRGCWALGDGLGGGCNSFTLAQALAAALRAGADVVNLSLGGPADPLLQRLVERGLRGGTVFVAATPAGGRREGFPSAVPGVIAVDAAGRAAAGTGTREAVAVVLRAPGSDVFTLSPRGRYDAASGSSIAAAQVSAVVALMLAHHPGLAPDEIEARLQRSSGVDGIVNACAALRRPGDDGDCRDRPAAAR